MNNTIHYLNTDLVLHSADDLTELAEAFKAAGVPPMYVTHEEDGLWYAYFETHERFEELGPNIAAMVEVVESWTGPLRSVWDGCTLREFNVGYDCGAEPWAFNQGLSTELLGRIAAVGGSLRFTLYPDRDGFFNRMTHLFRNSLFIKNLRFKRFSKRMQSRQAG
ncbi:hypothetical protein ACYOEI_24630 [Singulisphaera rosea]